MCIICHIWYRVYAIIEVQIWRQTAVCHRGGRALQGGSFQIVHLPKPLLTWHQSCHSTNAEPLWPCGSRRYFSFWADCGNETFRAVRTRRPASGLTTWPPSYLWAPDTAASSDPAALSNQNPHLSDEAAASAKEPLLSPPPSAVHPHIPPVLITQSASAGSRGTG